MSRDCTCTCGPYWSVVPPPPCPLHCFDRRPPEPFYPGFEPEVITTTDTAASLRRVVPEDS